MDNYTSIILFTTFLDQIKYILSFLFFSFECTNFLKTSNQVLSLIFYQLFCYLMTCPFFLIRSWYTNFHFILIQYMDFNLSDFDASTFFLLCQSNIFVIFFNVIFFFKNTLQNHIMFNKQKYLKLK